RLAEEAAGPRGPRAPRDARLWRVPRAVRLSAARLLAARSRLMGSPLEAFEKALAQDDARIDLAHACLLIAEDAYPGLAIERYLGDIERLALRLRARMPQDGGAEERVAALNEFLYEDLGFTGNTDDYYDPRNSYLNEVIERRTGIPITLGVLYM